MGRVSIFYIDWQKEATCEILTAEEMIAKLKELKETRTRIKGSPKAEIKARDKFDLTNYHIKIKGDYVDVYLYEKSGYKIYTNNFKDQSKNKTAEALTGGIRPDILFDAKFKHFNGISVRRAYGFVEATFKACIPKQFYYINDRFRSDTQKIRKVVASSIDASSQYPSGCLGRLPDAHTGVRVDHYMEPTEEYPFAFYNDGHCAEYGVFNTRNWLTSEFAPYLFRFDQSHRYCLLNLPDDQITTILMKPSEYTMDETWHYFYDQKKQCKKGTAEYEDAKGVMNKTIGMWHRKDKDEKANGYDYNNHGSYQLAHIVAIAIARGNQKILNKIEEIGAPHILHVCVDGIIYKGSYKHGIDESKLGEFAQEFIGADFVMTDYNNYIALQDDHCIKFKHGSFDLLNGQPIDENKDFIIEDLFHLTQKDRVVNYLWEDLI